MTYPTLTRHTPRLVTSEEGQHDSTGNWVPDFQLLRIGNQWHVKWRTSACWDSNVYYSLAEAEAAIRRSLAVPAARVSPTLVASQGADA
jgi:hypothetical protein